MLLTKLMLSPMLQRITRRSGARRWRCRASAILTADDLPEAQAGGTL